MTKKRVYAVQLSDFYPSATLPQAIGTIWSYAQLSEDVKAIYELVNTFWENQSAEEVSSKIFDPDVLMCSCYVWNWDRTYKIIKDVKTRSPNCLIVIGGPEPEYSVDWLTQHPEVDIVVPYYGEEVFLRILLENLKGKNFSEVPGTITKHQHNREVVPPSFNQIPSPYLNGFFDRLLSQRSPSTLSVRCVFETNRGCPYTCTFCDIGSKVYTKINAFDLNRCIAELQWIVTNKIDVVDVADANFGILPRDEVIVDALIKLVNDQEWEGRFLPTWSKSNSERVLRIARKLIAAGLESIFGLSLQSFNKGVLENIERKNAFNLEDLSQIVKDMNSNGVCVYTETIFPLPGDTLEGFKDGIFEMLDMEYVFDKFQINRLCRYSNTKMASLAYTQKYGIEWAKIRGFTQHYYGENSSDTIAICNSTICIDDVFEAIFFGKYFLMPVYFYGILRTFADEVHRLKLLKRKDLIQEVYRKLPEHSWFNRFKEEAKDHYFSAIRGERQVGYEMVEGSRVYFPEFALAHQTFLANNIHDILKSQFPLYVELIEFDRLSIRANQQSSEKLELKGFMPGIWYFEETGASGNLEYLEDVYIRGRFDNRWRKTKVERRNYL
jgi:radical SAM superfamily enzyme YgiQ (UPF0313 family)